MRLKWKLLILMLVIAFPAIMVIRLFDTIGMKRLGNEVSSSISQQLTDTARVELQDAVVDQGMVTRRNIQIAESTVYAQKLAIEKSLGNDRFRPRVQPELIDASDFDRFPHRFLEDRNERYINKQGDYKPLSLALPSVIYAPGVDKQTPQIRRRLAQIKRLNPVYRQLYRIESEVIYWHYTALEEGIHTSYPGHGGYPSQYDPRTRDWYIQAKEQGELIWTSPYEDASTGKLMFTCAAPFYHPDGTFAGVTAIDMTLEDLFSGMNIRTDWRNTTDIMFVTTSPELFTPSPEDDALSPPPSMIAEWRKIGANDQWDVHLPLKAIYRLPEDQLRDIETQMHANPNGVLDVKYDGQQSFWAYDEIISPELYIVYVVPEDTITIEATNTRMKIESMTWTQIESLIPVVAVILGLVIYAAFIASRRVTKDVIVLKDAANEVASGNLDAVPKMKRSDELGELAQAFRNMIPALKERMVMQDALSVAGQVQNQLLPSKGLSINNVVVHGASVYCDETGGDYFDYFYLTRDSHVELFTAVGDVTGHGVASALTMSTARALLQSYPRVLDHLSDIVTQLNQQLAMDSINGRFMTMMLMKLDIDNSKLEFISAGHDPIIVYDPDLDQFEEHDGHDIPLGVRSEWEFTTVKVQDFIRFGRIAVIGTDGIWEQRNAEGEMFGKERFKQVLRETARLQPSQIAACVIHAVTQFRGTKEQQDDVTLVVIKFI